MKIFKSNKTEIDIINKLIDNINKCSIAHISNEAIIMAKEIFNIVPITNTYNSLKYPTGVLYFNVIICQYAINNKINKDLIIKYKDKIVNSIKIN